MLANAESQKPEFGVPGLSLPPRTVFPSPPPSDRAKAFAANMSSFYANGDFMKTPFTADVDPMAPRPEHPRPQMYRADRWESLNGPWEVHP